jgi:hypothetical protein
MQWLGRMISGLNRSIENRFRLWTALVLTVMFSLSLARDMTKTMWIDELYTLHMALLPGVREIIKATLDGADGAPPLYSILVHALLAVVHSHPLAVRLPSTLGFCGMFLCILALCRRHLPDSYAFIAALTAACACVPFASEGRAYGLLVFAAAAALICWQRATEDGNRALFLPLLALSMGVVTALHYLSIFLAGPLLFGELVRMRIRRRLDWPILVALIVPPLLILALHYPLIQAARKFQEHYWSPANWGVLVLTYGHYFRPPFIFSVAVLLAGFLLCRTCRGESRRKGAFPSYEWAALATMAIMPALICILSMYTTHAFVPRYVIWCVPGFSVFVVAAAWVMSSRPTAPGALMVVPLLIAFSAISIYYIRNQLTLFEGNATLAGLMALPASPEPIVIADHHIFMELSYYAPPNIREHVLYPISRELDLKYFGTDTGSLMMEALRGWTKLNVQHLDDLASLKTFILVATSRDYLPPYFIKQGYTLTSVGRRADAEIYYVQRPSRN